MNAARLRRWARTIGPVAAATAALVVGLVRPQHARADGEAEATERRERCATRLSIAFRGAAASPEFLAAPDPQSAVDGLLADPTFIDRFARFTNAAFNAEPGETLADNASYTLAKHVLTTGTLAWKEMFVGKFEVGDAVQPNEGGLGYFRSPAWMKRYEGNEPGGYRITTAYRILQNTTGLTLAATTNVDGADLTADGRKAAACKGCHYEGWFALDLVAKVLPRRNTAAETPAYLPPTEGPQVILDGKSIANDGELVEALVASDDFTFNTCRLAFEFLYGRAENGCEGRVFDACVDAFRETGRMQSALAAIAKDPTFCQ